MKLDILSLLIFLSLAVNASAETNDTETVKLKAKTERYTKLVQAQPDWLISRLQMYWSSHATDVYIRGEAFDHPGGNRAPEPTVKFAGTRSTESQYDRPKLEDIVPYDDDAAGDVTYINHQTGKMEKTSPAKTGCNIQGVNRQIMSIARDAAKVYAATRDTIYGNMAARVFDVYMKGIYYRNVPVDLNHGHQQTLVGMTTFEVIHEDIINELTQTYPLIKPLLGSDTTLVDAAFKKWADNIIANGVPHNNWNLFQADFIQKIALVLNDDRSYADGKGRQHYLAAITHDNSIRQWSMDKLISFGFNNRSNTWYEAPGYSLTVLNTFADFANSLDSKAGIDLFSQHPILIKALETSPQYLFPNRMFAGFGDSHPTYIKTEGMDRVVDYATRHHNTQLKDDITELKNVVLPTASDKDVARYTSGVFYAPNVSWIVLRSGMNKQHDLMASLNASLGNHQHANGLSIELYGKGYVLGPDAGIGKYLYSGLDYSEYYSQMPAHNTVVVDGISSYPVMMSNHPFKLMVSYPTVTADQPASTKLSEKDNEFSYTTVSFIEPESHAQQQRTVAVVKTSEKGGFYIDVFRSKKMEGGDKTHDYFYHNLGQTMTLTDFNGNTLPTKPTEELVFAGGHLYAYSYIYNKESVETTKGVKATFTTKIESDKVVKAMDNQHSITMTMWMAPSQNRTIFKALAPVNMEYERMPNQPYNIGQQPVLTFVARQHGEAWNHPFVCVYEPSSDTEPGDIASVNFFSPKEKNAVGVKVSLKNGHTMTFTIHENGKIEKK